MKTVHLIITGKVQGVFFRESARKVAGKLNLKGWIKNNHDGKVEATVTGEEKCVSNFINWCKTGPERADVENVIVSEKPESLFKKFEVRR